LHGAAVLHGKSSVDVLVPLEWLCPKGKNSRSVVSLFPGSADSIRGRFFDDL
jgi:hypothetical protein